MLDTCEFVFVGEGLLLLVIFGITAFKSPAVTAGQADSTSVV